VFHVADYFRIEKSAGIAGTGHGADEKLLPISAAASLTTTASTTKIKGFHSWLPLNVRFRALWYIDRSATGTA
jgi:hypothetical protein